MLKERGTQHKVNQEAYAILLAHLVKWPASSQELAEVSGLHIVTVQSLMRVFRRRGVVFVAGWDLDRFGRVTTPVFALKLKATDTDVSRGSKTRAEIAQDYRARRKIAPISERIKQARAPGE